MLLLKTHLLVASSTTAAVLNSNDRMEADGGSILQSLNLHEDLHLGDNNIIDVLITGVLGSTSYLTIWLDSNRDQVYQKDEVILEDYEINLTSDTDVAHGDWLSESIQISFDISHMIRPGMSSIGLELNEQTSGSGSLLDFQKVIVPVYKRKRIKKTGVPAIRNPHTLNPKTLKKMEYNRSAAMNLDQYAEEASNDNSAIKHAPQSILEGPEENTATFWMITGITVCVLVIAVVVGVGLAMVIEKKKKSQADAQARLGAVQLQKAPIQNTLTEWETF